MKLSQGQFVNYKMPRLYNNKSGNTYSIYPPQTWLTFEYWIYCVPQYKPQSVLLLGCAGATIAGLTKLIWGDVPITAVDLDVPPDNPHGVNFIQADAREYVKTCPKFDCVIVDLFNRDRSGMCDFVTTPEFAEDVGRVGNYIILNTINADMTEYRKRYRKMGVNKPTGSKLLIYYFLNGPMIKDLHPWRT